MGREDKNNLSVQGKGVDKKCALAAMTPSCVFPQILTQKVTKVPGSRHTGGHLHTLLRKWLPGSVGTQPQDTTSLHFKCNGPSFLTEDLYISSSSRRSSHQVTGFPMHLSKRTGNQAVHERGVGVGSTSVCGPCLPLMRARAGEGHYGATGDRGKLWNRNGECRDPASHSAPCFPTASPEAERRQKAVCLSPCYGLPSPTTCPEVMMNVPCDKQLRTRWTHPGHIPPFFLQPSTLTQPWGAGGGREGQ